MSNIAKLLQNLKSNLKSVPSTPKICNKCQDKEVITKLNEQGILEIIRPCDCVKVKQYKQIIKSSGLAGKIEECTFENFNAYISDLKFAKMMAEKFVTDNKAETLLFLGKTGTGKTHLATAVVGKLLEEHRKPVLYARYSEIIPKLRALAFNLTEREKYINSFKKVPYLYIDDLFKNMESRYETEKQLVFEILDSRYSMHLKTIITSEYNLKKLLETDEAMAGRLGERARGYIMNFDNIPNYRAKKTTIEMKKQREAIQRQAMLGG